MVNFVSNGNDDIFTNAVSALPCQRNLCRGFLLSMLTWRTQSRNVCYSVLLCKMLHNKQLQSVGVMSRFIFIFFSEIIGNDCSQVEKKGFWEVVESQDIPLGSASHCSVLVNDYLWVFGGSQLNLEPQEAVLQRYDFKGNFIVPFNVMYSILLNFYISYINPNSSKYLGNNISKGKI